MRSEGDEQRSDANELPKPTKPHRTFCQFWQCAPLILMLAQLEGPYGMRSCTRSEPELARLNAGAARSEAEAGAVATKMSPAGGFGDRPVGVLERSGKLGSAEQSLPDVHDELGDATKCRARLLRRAHDPYREVEF